MSIFALVCSILSIAFSIAGRIEILRARRMLRELEGRVGMADLVRELDVRTRIAEAETRRRQ